MPNRLESGEVPYSAGQKVGDIMLILQQSDASSSSLVLGEFLENLISKVIFCSLQLSSCHEELKWVTHLNL